MEEIIGKFAQFSVHHALKNVQSLSVTHLILKFNCFSFRITKAFNMASEADIQEIALKKIVELQSPYSQVFCHAINGIDHKAL